MRGRCYLFGFIGRILIFFKQRRIFYISIFFLGFFLEEAFSASLADSIPYFNLGVRPTKNAEEVSLALQVLFLVTVISIVPAILLMSTSFIRIVIILRFVQRALSLQQEPPGQVIMGFSFFLTLFVMQPTATEMYKNAYVPLSEKKIGVEQFFKESSIPLRKFLFSQTRQKDIDLFLYLSGKGRPKDASEVSTLVLMPAFIISELTTAFKVGVYILIPFLVIDMIVSSILMSMGMIMLPPVMVSFPFKLILFLLVDGWHLIVLQTVRSFGEIR